MPKGIHTVDLDSRRQTGRDSEIAPTNMKSCKKQQNYHVTSTSRYKWYSLLKTHLQLSPSPEYSQHHHH